MTDLEMTKLCAEAMGYIVDDWGILAAGDNIDYNPLRKDGQAMALMKRFGICVSGPTAKEPDRNWYAFPAIPHGAIAESTDLNRAIVECCAKMWLSRSKSHDAKNPDFKEK